MLFATFLILKSKIMIMDIITILMSHLILMMILWN
jgi:hypothetical protein